MIAFIAGLNIVGFLVVMMVIYSFEPDTDHPQWRNTLKFVGLMALAAFLLGNGIEDASNAFLHEVADTKIEVRPPDILDA